MNDRHLTQHPFYSKEELVAIQMNEVINDWKDWHPGKDFVVRKEYHEQLGLTYTIEEVNSETE